MPSLITSRTASTDAAASVRLPQVASDDRHRIGKRGLADLFEQVSFDVPADRGDRDVIDGGRKRSVQDRAHSLEHDEHPRDHHRERDRPPGIGGGERAEQAERQQGREGRSDIWAGIVSARLLGGNRAGMRNKSRPDPGKDVHGHAARTRGHGATSWRPRRRALSSRRAHHRSGWRLCRSWRGPGPRRGTPPSPRRPRPSADASASCHPRARPSTLRPTGRAQ